MLEKQQQFSNLVHVVFGQTLVRYSIFNVLPFGLNSACYCFTKVIRNFLKRWRSFRHRRLAYIDDSISRHKNKQLAIEASSMQKKDLTDSGFIYNDEKPQWEPRQCGSWLRFMINTVRFLFKIPPEKVATNAKIENFIHFLIRLLNGFSIRANFQSNVSLLMDASRTGFVMQIFS